MNKRTKEVYVRLLEEGTDTIRITQAIDTENGTYRLLPAENYDPEDEIWEFVPGTVVKIKRHILPSGEKIWYAYEEG